MVWIAGLVALVLLFVFPKQMFALLGACALLGGVAFLYFQSEQASRERDRNAVTVEVAYGNPACSPEYPLAVNFHNGSRKTVNKVEWRFAAFQSGYSSDIVDQPSYSRYSSDRILAPGERFGLCYQPPALERNLSPADVRWEAEVTYVYFK